MFKVKDKVLVTCQILRKNPQTSKPETINLSEEEGVVEKASASEKTPQKNSYHVKTKYGVHMVSESKLTKK